MVSFEQAKSRIASIAPTVLIIPTLGGKSKIRVSVSEGDIIIQNSGVSKFHINEEKWNVVYIRRNHLVQSEKNRTGQYGRPGWENMPNIVNYIEAPYIPAVMRFLEDENDSGDFQGETVSIEPDTPVDPSVEKLFNPNERRNHFFRVLIYLFKK